MKKTTTTIILVLVMLGMGCSSTYFCREDTTFEQCKKDNEECGYMALRKYPDLFWDSGLKRYEVRKQNMESRGYELYKFKGLPAEVNRTELYKGQTIDGGSAGT